MFILLYFIASVCQCFSSCRYMFHSLPFIVSICQCLSLCRYYLFCYLSLYLSTDFFPCVVICLSVIFHYVCMSVFVLFSVSFILCSFFLFHFTAHQCDETEDPSETMEYDVNEGIWCLLVKVRLSTNLYYVTNTYLPGSIFCFALPVKSFMIIRQDMKVIF